MPPKENPERACEECIHFFACSRQCGEPMAQSSATGCECYETVKSIAAASLIEQMNAESVVLPDGQVSAIESLLKEMVDYAIKNNWNLNDLSDCDVINGYLYDGKPEIYDVMGKIVKAFGVPEGEL